MVALPRTVVRAALFDVVAVLIFVAVGRRSHDEDGSVVSGVLSVAAPFLIALAVGWFATKAWRKPATLHTGVRVWIVTVALGMVLRRFVFDDGTALSFVIVATLVLGALLLGWRLLYRRFGPRTWT